MVRKCEAGIAVKGLEFLKLFEVLLHTYAYAISNFADFTEHFRFS